MDEKQRLLIVGCGYVGREVAGLVLSEGWQVYGLTRTHQRFETLQSWGVEPIQGHWLDPASLGRLPMVDRVLVAVPHREDQALGNQTHVAGLRNLVHAFPSDDWRMVYLSTTGVYGECDHQTVDERTPVRPARSGPEIAVAAERYLQSHIPQAVVLRLAGIYGPGRIPLASKLRAGEPLAVPREGHLNLVHLADIARMVQWMLQHTPAQPLYVFSDGQAVRREEFYRYLAELCGVPEPQFVPPDPASSRARRASDKRVDPSLLVQESKFEYRFADYRQGLAQALEDGGRQS